MSSKIKIKKVTNKADLQKVFAIREEVFIGEQSCPPEEEWEFEDESIHFLATVDEQPAGATRWRKTDNGYKLERFSVLQHFRGRGVAQALVQAVLDDLPTDANYIYLNGQVQAMRLYQKFGFEKTGPEFMEAGIRHYRMVKR